MIKPLSISREKELYSRIEKLRSELEREYETNKKLNNFLHFVCTDYIELSHEKVLWQRNDWLKMARKIRNEISTS